MEWGDTGMKKRYEAPLLEVERYELDANIASNCRIVVSNGPEIGDHKGCEDYKDPFSTATYSLNREAIYNVQFYEDTNCDCYTTGSDYGYWTS